MRTPPLLADFSHARACKPFCENSLTLPNTFYMARRRQEQTHTQRWDRDMERRETSHFLPLVVK